MVLHYMHGYKVCMLINMMSGYLVFVGYSDIGFARCVDIKVSTSCNILTLACGAISWKSSKNDKDGISNDAINYVAC